MPRLDQETVRRGICPSRERAKEYITSGQVSVNGVEIKKPSFEVSETDIIVLSGETLKYVGRGGLKLEKALKSFEIDASGLICLDIGASTGGFTDCLLQNGAKKVYAADVGRGQLSKKLLNDKRVVNMEGVNVKDLSAAMFDEKIDFAVSDLSFISSRFSAEAIKRILTEGSGAAILIKPQFEAGKKYLGKSGIVKDRNAHEDVLKSLCAYYKSIGLSVRGLIPSPITGGDGNIEYLAHLVKSESFTDIDIDYRALVDTAFKEKAVKK